uniref:Uncharacterized protein n=1 Tax=Anguilla anguilla TaxID=7936 RepID=A0A0E9PNU7_ANGAN
MTTAIIKRSFTGRHLNARCHMTLSFPSC